MSVCTSIVALSTIQTTLYVILTIYGTQLSGQEVVQCKQDLISYNCI